LNKLSIRNYSPSVEVLKEFMNIDTLYLWYTDKTFDVDKAKVLKKSTNIYLDDIESLWEDESISKALFSWHRWLVSLGITELTWDQAKFLVKNVWIIRLKNLKDIDENSEAFRSLSDFSLETWNLRVHPDLQIKIDKRNNKIK
jgi:hypothetical protein